MPDLFAVGKVPEVVEVLPRWSRQGSRRRRFALRKRLAVLVTALAATAVVLPAAPASATTCIILPDPGVDDVLCLVYGTPGIRQLCDKSVLC